jgi:hypothetical protein
VECGKQSVCKTHHHYWNENYPTFFELTGYFDLGKKRQKYYMGASNKKHADAQEFN